MLSRLQPYRVKVYGKSSNKVVFLYCPFGIRRWQLRLPFLPIERLLRHGYQVIVFDFNVRHVTSSAPEVFAILDSVRNETHRRIEELQKAGVTDISAFGTSMGTQFATYVSAHEPAIRKIVLNLAYGDLYEQICAFPVMRFLSKKRIQNFMESAGSSDNLERKARKYSSVELAPRFKDRKVLLYLARQDEVMPIAISSKFRYALENNGVELRYIENDGLSHYMSAFKNHLKSSEYLRFLDEVTRK